MNGACCCVCCVALGVLRRLHLGPGAVVALDLTLRLPAWRGLRACRAASPGGAKSPEVAHLDRRFQQLCSDEAQQEQQEQQERQQQQQQQSRGLGASVGAGSGRHPTASLRASSSTAASSLRRSHFTGTASVVSNPLARTATTAFTQHTDATQFTRSTATGRLAPPRGLVEESLSPVRGSESVRRNISAALKEAQDIGIRDKDVQVCGWLHSTPRPGVVAAALLTMVCVCLCLQWEYAQSMVYNWVPRATVGSPPKRKSFAGVPHAGWSIGLGAAISQGGTVNGRAPRLVKSTLSQEPNEPDWYRHPLTSTQQPPSRFELLHGRPDPKLASPPSLKSARAVPAVVQAQLQGTSNQYVYRSPLFTGRKPFAVFSTQP